ncbi:hypothetical protein Ancab_025037, partial [Ancistrocladus abbreviatus]
LCSMSCYMLCFFFSSHELCCCLVIFNTSTSNSMSAFSTIVGTDPFAIVMANELGSSSSSFVFSVHFPKAEAELITTKLSFEESKSRALALN